MNHIYFRHHDGRNFRVSTTPGNMNSTIQQRFMVGEKYDRECWATVNGPNGQLRSLAIEALAQHVA